MGLALVAMTALGMTLTMGGLGLASVLARSLLAGGSVRTLEVVDVAGAAFITILRRATAF